MAAMHEHIAEAEAKITYDPLPLVLADPIQLGQISRI